MSVDVQTPPKQSIQNSAQQSAFKHLYSEMIRNNGDFSKISESIPKKQIKCYVKESFPHFLVTDNFFFVACYFTKTSVEDFKAKYPSINITDLKSRVIVITDWALEIIKVDSTEVFTSYGGIEIKLIVKSFKTSLQDKDKITLTRYPVNLFRDDEMKTLIQNYTHSCILGAVKSSIKTESLPDILKFSSKSNVTQQGVISFAQGSTFSGFGFKDGKTATIDMITIFKQEKGVGALKKYQNNGGMASAGKVKVVGGAKLRKQKANDKLLGKGNLDVKRIAEKISKFTPGGKSNSAKRSTHRILTGKTPTLPSPGAGSQAGTTNHQSMEDFKKMVAYFNKKYKANQQGKKSLGKRTGGKISLKTVLKSGKKSQK